MPLSEERRRRIRHAVTYLQSSETRLENAKKNLASELSEANEESGGASYQELANYLGELGKPVSRQRIGQIIHGDKL